MKYKSNIDDLTGLPLRGEIKRYISQKIKNKIPFHLYIVDIDYFKVINDQFGHPRGDEIIKDVADLLSNTIGEEGFVGRYGGDEFIIVVKGGGKVEDIPLRIAEHLSLRDFPGDPPIKLSLSFGFASYPAEGKTYGTLLKLADRRLLEKKRKRHAGIRLIGRDNIISFLKSVLSDANKGNPGFIHLVGKEGSGKTRVLDEISVIAGMMNFEILYSRCRATGVSNPLNMFSISGMVNIGWKISWKLREMAREKPLLWIIDDIEYCSSEMADVLKDVFHLIEKERIVIVISGKPEYILKGFTRIEISPFDLKTTGEFIKALLGIGNIDQKFVLYVHKESGGFPHKIMKIVNSCVNSGILGIKDGNVVIKEDGIVIDIDKNIIDRFSTFSSKERKFFLYLALMEDAGTIQNLSRLLRISEEKLEKIKKKGIETGLLVMGEDLRFVDGSLGQAIIEKENPSRNILSKIAQFLFDNGYYRVAGKLFERAHKFKEASISYMNYVEELMNHGLLADAIKFLEGLNRWDGQSWFESKEYHSTLSSYHFRMGNYKRAIEELEKAYKDGKMPEFYLKKAKCLARMGNLKEAYETATNAGEIALPYLTELLLRIGEVDRAEEVGNEAIFKIQEPEYLMEAYAALGGVMISKRKLEKALHHLSTGLAIASNLNDYHWLGIYHNRIGICYFLRARLTEAKEHYNKAIYYFSELGDTGTLIYMYLNLALIHFNESNIDSALKNYFKAYTIAKDIQQKELLGKVARHIGGLYLEIGEIERAKKFMDEALSVLKTTKQFSELSSLYVGMARVSLVLSRFDEAKEFIQRAKGIAEKLKSPILKAEALMREGEYHLKVGNFETAKKILERIKTTCPDDIKGEYFLLLARVYDIMEKPGLARKYGEKALQHHKLHGTLWAIGKDYYVLSRLKTFSEKSGEYMELAKDIFRRCGIEKGYEDYI